MARSAFDPILFEGENVDAEIDSMNFPPNQPVERPSVPHDEPPSTNNAARRAFPIRNARTLTLAVLVVLTSWAVGVTTSAWLVPPYLIAMAWLLMAPSPRRTAIASQEAQPPADRTEIEVDASHEPSPNSTVESTEPPKPKSTRSRGRKPKAKVTTTEPVVSVAATWVQVAPGKFVRVEIPCTSGNDELTLTELEPAPPQSQENSSDVQEPSVDTEPIQPAPEPTGDEAELLQPSAPSEAAAMDEPAYSSGEAVDIPGQDSLEPATAGSASGDLDPESIMLAVQAVTHPLPTEAFQDDHPSLSAQTATEPLPVFQTICFMSVEPLVASVTLEETPAHDESDHKAEESSDLYDCVVTQQVEPSRSDDPSDNPTAQPTASVLDAPPPTRTFLARTSTGRSIRIRKQWRPKQRRGNGRVGASPRVILHRE